MITLPPNPCKDCVPPKRYGGCHAECKDGIDYGNILKARNDEIKAERKKESSFAMFKVERVAETKKKAGVK